MTTAYVGLDGGHGAVVAAEHWLRELAAGLGAAASLVACTHLVRVPWPHVAVSLALPARTAGVAELPPVPAELAEAAAWARDEHVTGQGGRAVIFPGWDRLAGELTVAELLAGSAIDRVSVLGGPPAGPDTVVWTRGHVRPQWIGGELTLVTAPAADGRIAPFEVPNPTPCCADHAL